MSRRQKKIVSHSSLHIAYHPRVCLTSGFWILVNLIAIHLWMSQEIQENKIVDLSKFQSPATNVHAHHGQWKPPRVEDSLERPPLSLLRKPQTPELWTYRAVNLSYWKPLSGREEERTGPGEMGKGLTLTPFMREEMNKTYHINNFNLYGSDSVAFDRSLPDRRPTTCINLDHPPLLPATSVIIVFHNEAWSSLMRTIVSIKNRTPRKLLHEILLIDDFSNQTHLATRLELKVTEFRRGRLPISLHRMPEWSGLVKARLYGARLATGKVLTFLDSHCECNHGWLEPLLAEIYRNRTNVVCPVIDTIDADTLGYGYSPSSMTGGFSWKLIFKWTDVSPAERARVVNHQSQALRTPAMAGGLFAMDREYFYHLGSYDDQMLFWGGENVELSLRIWQCGGTLLIHPCSHVGHIFRKGTPHKWDGGSTGQSLAIARNLGRTVEVWMDDPWQDFYYKVSPGAKAIKTGDLTERLDLKARLQCKSFSWYITEIYTGSDWTLDYKFMGQIRNNATDLCFDVRSLKTSGQMGLWPCHGMGGPQTIMLNYPGQLKHDEMCIKSDKENEAIKVMKCQWSINSSGQQNSTTWTYSPESQHLKNPGSDLCASVVPIEGESAPKLRMELCRDPQDSHQAWELNSGDYAGIEPQFLLLISSLYSAGAASPVSSPSPAVSEVQSSIQLGNSIVKCLGERIKSGISPRDWSPPPSGRGERPPTCLANWQAFSGEFKIS
eukprot:maker-scaffold319_size207808-snap-gene-0.26 protein:Tk00368 transcript:maker-scaffold319_size207808-snap-gene-0.26-mRNA-1 annotation:"polypeptide n-acetylgalactosaminyltransferase 5 isoform x1"